MTEHGEVARILIDHEQRLTRLEDRTEMAIAALAARLEKLEAIAEQQRIDDEQARRRELAALRSPVTAQIAAERTGVETTRRPDQSPRLSSPFPSPPLPMSSPGHPGEDRC